MGETGVEQQWEMGKGWRRERKGGRYPPHVRSPPTFQPWLRVCTRDVSLGPDWCRGQNVCLGLSPALDLHIYCRRWSTETKRVGGSRSSKPRTECRSQLRSECQQFGLGRSHMLGSCLSPGLKDLVSVPTSVSRIRRRSRYWSGSRTLALVFNTTPKTTVGDF